MGSPSATFPQQAFDLVTHLTTLESGLDPEALRGFVAELEASTDFASLSPTELETFVIQQASMKISESFHFSRLAAALLLERARHESISLGIRAFSDAIEFGHAQGLVSDALRLFVKRHRAKLDALVRPERNACFDFIGAKTLYDRYLLRDPATRASIETPQYAFLRVACGLSRSVEEAAELYELVSRLDYVPSTPTLFNSGTRHPQMSSCYLLDSPVDDLRAIYDGYASIAMLSKFAGGIGVAFHRIRSRGSLIRGTNGFSNGIVPWLKTLDSSVAAVNQGGRRKGACAVYLETWHADVEEFLELRNGTGDEARRTHNLNLANWVPDLFMKRVEADALWSLFDPKAVPDLCDLYGEDFEARYAQAEADRLFVKQIPARELYGRMMVTLAQTGNGWINFKDPSNLKCNQTGTPGKVVHLSNLCTEILEVTDASTTAVCNLGSVCLSRHLREDGAFDFDKLGRTVRTAVKYLDRVIDINLYPIPSAASSNAAWRPVGLGVMGFQDVLFKLRLPFDSAEARALSVRIQEQIYFEALSASCDLAKAHGAHESFALTRAAQGQLQFDLWGATPSDRHDWAGLKARIAEHGLRNSLLIAIAPTVTIASIAGCQESIEPQVSNLFKRETLSGEFLQVNRYLWADLARLGLWTDAVRSQIKRKNGSIQGILEIPEEIRLLYRTAWEVPMRTMIDMAAERGAYIDQSQSLNLFLEQPTLEKMSSMYFYAWKKGLKTTYYLRSRPATEISQTTPSPAKPAAACDLENPESCETCQ
jgi:ribonucleoside-diphosphate reductase alpha chain